jgi:hypothetical protein
MSIRSSLLPVPKLCQNPICLVCKGLPFEREQLPQVVDNKHFRIELIEHLEPVIVLCNQQVAGSIPAGGSIKSTTYTNGQHERHVTVPIFVPTIRILYPGCTHYDSFV